MSSTENVRGGEIVLIVAISPLPSNHLQPSLESECYIIVSPNSLFGKRRKVFFKDPDEYRRLSEAEKRKIDELNFAEIVMES